MPKLAEWLPGYSAGEKPEDPKMSMATTHPLGRTVQSLDAVYGEAHPRQSPDPFPPSDITRQIPMRLQYFDASAGVSKVDPKAQITALPRTGFIYGCNSGRQLGRTHTIERLHLPTRFGAFRHGQAASVSISEV